MAGFDGSGNYVRPYNWVNDAAGSIPITASRFDTDGTTVQGAFNNCLTRDGQGKPTGSLLWSQPLTLSPSSGTALTLSPASGTGLSITAGGMSVTGTSTISGATTITGVLTANSFIPTSSTVPVNGMYLSAANTLNFATNTVSRLSISSAGVTTFAANVTITTGGLTVSASGIAVTGASTITGALSGLTTVSASGAVTGGSFIPSSATVPTNGLYLSAANTVAIASNGALQFSVNSTGNTVFTAPSSGVGVTIHGFTGTHSTKIDDSAGNSWDAGFLGAQRSTTTTTAAVGDRGKCIAVTTNIAIPNSTFAAGDTVSIYNNSAASINITHSAGTGYIAGVNANNASIVLATRGFATIWFNSATEWSCSGNVS